MFYYDPKNIRITRTIKTQLTHDQIRRAEVSHRIFEEFLGPSSEDWLEEFAYEIPVNAEAEIRLWQRMGNVYLKEQAERPVMSREERRLLCLAVIQSSGYASIGQLLSAMPELKRLDHIERVFDRVRAEGPSEYVAE